MGEPITGENGDNISSEKNKYTLKGLKVMKSLNNRKFFSEITDGFKSKTAQLENEDIPDSMKKIIKDYPLEVVIFDQQGNTEKKAVDNFIRLNQNAHPIACNSFELWNSYNIIKIIDKIKEVAKCKIFKQSGKRMKEEEMVTILAYIASQNINIHNLEEFFSIKKNIFNKDKLNEHYEIQIAIKPNKKADITEYLENIEPNSEKETEFSKYIHEVKIFSEKLKILCDDDYKKLLEVFNPNIKSPRKGNAKDYYISWLLLKDLDIHFIDTYKTEIFKELKEIIYFMKNIPETKKEQDFIRYVKQKIDYYTETCGKNI